MSMNGDLPEDLVLEILSRLPVKSLMRFKCVCKSWRSLFKSPTFVAKHLNNDSDDSLLLKHIDKASNKHVFSLLSNETLDVIENLDFPHHKVDKLIRGLEVVSCCNGIVCMANNVDKEGGNIFLWNPATKEFKILPQSQLPRPSNMYAHTGPVGFGFDAKANDYKVVHLPYFTTPSLGTSDDLYQAEIYNLKSGSWRKSDATVPADVIIINGGPPDVYIHGIYSWIGLEGYGPCVIVSFDMNKEVIITTALPDHSKDYVIMTTALNESIALIIHMEHNKWMSGISEVWVLNEYTVKESWTKLYTVGPVLELHWISGFWKNGDMFGVTYEQKLVLFNPVTLEMKDLQLDYLQQPWIGLYKESLISIN